MAFELYCYKLSKGKIKLGTILNSLKGGDRRSIGEVDKVIKKVGKNQKSFDDVFEGVFSDDEILRMRACDAIENISRENPHLLQSNKRKLMKNITTSDQQEFRWHVSLMLSYLKLTKNELPIVIDTIIKWLYTEKKSQIVKVNCMQALANLAKKNFWFKSEVISIIEEQMLKGGAAVKARGRILLKQLS